MQVQRQYAYKYNFIKIEYEHLIEDWAFCAVYLTSKLLGWIPDKEWLIFSLEALTLVFHDTVNGNINFMNFWNVMMRLMYHQEIGRNWLEYSHIYSWFRLIYGGNP